MSKFKVGDRVVSYDSMGAITGQVLEIRNYELYLVGWDPAAATPNVINTAHIYHEKQLRRLVKKPRRNMWVNIYKATDYSGYCFYAYDDKEMALRAAAASDSVAQGTAVLFIEAKKK